jgi:pantoate--beta-alanine ligase
MPVMEIVKTIAQARALRSTFGRLALVPTMGALHAGHMSLLAHAKNNAPHVAVSIFVNPTQFGPKEDYTKYPRPIEEDLEKCESAGVDFIFMPSAEEMYPPGVPDIAIDLPSLATVLEGKHRPGHFKGVCQVVAKLFNIIQPSAACFGQKDFQQLRIIAAMVQSMNMPIDIIPCPTLRDPDGLAMSSRNAYLSPEDRQRALSISRALLMAFGEFKNGFRQANRLTATMQKILLEQHLSIDYVASVDTQTLKTVDKVEGPTLLAIAARVGNTRLIDNVVITPEEAKTDDHHLIE